MLIINSILIGKSIGKRKKNSILKEMNKLKPKVVKIKIIKNSNFLIYITKEYF